VDHMIYLPPSGAEYQNRQVNSVSPIPVSASSHRVTCAQKRLAQLGDSGWENVSNNQYEGKQMKVTFLLRCCATLVLGLSTAVLALTVEEPMPLPEGGDVGIQVSAPAAGSTRLVYTYPDMTTNAVMIEGEQYTTVRIPGEGFTSEIGSPELPMVNRLVGIPELGGVQVRVVSAEYTETHGIKVFPMQPWKQTNQDDDQRPFTINQAAYRSDTWYPSEIATVSDPAVFRDIRLAVVSTYPVQYNPATGTVRTYSSIEVVVEPTGQPGVNEKTHHFDHPSSSFLPMYRELVNYELLELDEERTLPGTVLMVCYNNATVLGYVNQLADWKRKRGTSVTVATLDQTGSSSSQIKNYVQTFYNTSDPPLEFLILVGDATTSGDPFSVPAFGSTDHDYSTLAGGDDLPDIAVGRLSCNTANELNLLVTKSIHYERTPYIANPNWFTRGYLLAGYSHSCWSNVTTKQWVRSRMYQNGYDDVVLETCPGHVPSTFRNQVNAGCTFFNWRGGWMGEMTTGDLTGLSNGWMLPQVVVITCGTGDFSGTGAGLTEAWIRYGSIANGSGALTCIGTNGYGTHVGFNNGMDASYFYGFFVEGLPEAGLALMSAKLQFYRNYWPWQSSYVSAYFEYVNLMGDPEVKTWTAVPIQVLVDHPSTLTLGCNQIEVVVTDQSLNPIPEMLVTAKGSSTYSRAFTDEDGRVFLPVEETAAGTLHITTWKHNYLAHESDVTISQGALWVSYESVTVDDDNLGGTSGNDDGILNPGEVVDLSVTVHNYGSSQTGTNVVGTITSLDLTTAQVLTASQNFPNVAPGANVTSTNPFRIRVVNTSQDQELVRLLLEITASGNDQTSLFELTIESGDLVYVTHQFTGSNNRLDPGETETMNVTVANVGHRNITGATGTFFTSSNFISFPVPQASYGSINQGSNGTNSTLFQITANPMTFPGTRVELGLAFSGASSFRDTVTFMVNVGVVSSTDPTGPDEYGYYCFDDTDVDYEMRPTYEWIEIDPTHGGSGQVLPLNDTYEDADQSLAISIPFDFQMYGIAKDSITVCTNGWVALGDQDQFVDFRNFHIPGPFGPDLMIAPFWDDLVTTGGRICAWYDAANGWYVVEWSNVKTLYGSHIETFEVLLYNTDVWPTLSGDGLIKFQYQTVYQSMSGSNDNDYATIGIENDTQDIGLEISYWNTYSPGIATVQANRAYLITNMVTFQVGALTGTVTNAATGNPIVGALVTAENGSYWDTTDASGHYFVPDMLINDYNLTCSRLGFNDAMAQVTITENDTLVQNFALLHPEFLLDVSGITATLGQGDTSHYAVHLDNNGNGELEYDIAMDFHLYDGVSAPGGTTQLQENRGPVAPPSGTDDPWEELLNFNVTFQLGDHLIEGVAFAWGRFWVTGGGVVSSMPNKLYQFDLMGNYIGSITQPSVTIHGYRDLAFDGQYFWGSEDQWIVSFDTTGAIHDSILGQLNPNRCLAYDPAEDVLYTGDITNSIIVLDREGNEIRRYEDHGLRIYGLAWFRDDPDGCPLYMFCQPDIQVYKMDPAIGTSVMVALLSGHAAGDAAGGAEMSTSWNPLFYTLVGQIMGQPEDRVGVWEIAPNTAWITYGPSSGTVAAGGQQTFDILLDAREMALGQYGVNLVYTHNAISQSDTLPIRLTVTATGVEEQTLPVPFTYSLDQNFPNPFNPTTVIPYSIRDHGRVRLTVFNILGQEVAELVDAVQDPGQHQAVLDVHRLSSGIYFYRLEAGTFVKTRKMVILK